MTKGNASECSFNRLRCPGGASLLAFLKVRMMCFQVLVCLHSLDIDKELLCLGNVVY